MKRYQQHVQDHEHYKEAYWEAWSWLQATEDRLSACKNTAGDKYLLQTQLEKLQVIHRSLAVLWKRRKEIADLMEEVTLRLCLDYAFTLPKPS